MCIEFIATTVGGGYINGTAESIATNGLVWTLAPFGIFIGLNLGKFYCGILICIKEMWKQQWNDHLMGKIYKT